MESYVDYYLPRDAVIAEIAPGHDALAQALGRDMMVVEPRERTGRTEIDWAELERLKPDRLLLTGGLHFAEDALELLERVRCACSADTRLVVVYYSALWRPAFRVASALGLTEHGPEQTWLAPSDIKNLFDLAGFETTAHSQRILIPVKVPFMSWFANRWLATLPVFRLFTIANVVVARPLMRSRVEHRPSVAVVVPARNERGTIEEIVRRIPEMGPKDEIIFVEGHSTDGTWDEIVRVASQHHARSVRCFKQTGSGKGDAVRLGFAHAEREILMILDADLSVPPEALPHFYRAMTEGVGEFINGSRLVYPMEQRAMRFLNILGNKFFAAAFSFLLGQPIKDTLCGTKVMSRDAYRLLERERYYFGDFDPFGDFDLLFGASRLGLKIVELPVRYGERTYGTTNIQRFTHGWLLLRMTVFAARRMKFI